MKSTLPSKALRHGSWASVVSTPVGLATPPDVMLQSALADQTALLQICLARVGSLLERAEAALSSLCWGTQQNFKIFLRVTKIYLWRNQQRGEGECIYIPL